MKIQKGIPEVHQILDEIREIHEKKNADYAAAGHPFENFQRSAAIASWFNHDEDKAFAVLIGTKLARIATLLNNGLAPQNETLKDSFRDLATYSILWGAKHERENK